jgi:hypothetical protein
MPPKKHRTNIIVTSFMGSTTKLSVLRMARAPELPEHQVSLGETLAQHKERQSGWSHKPSGFRREASP